jgi:hypothetical protein
LFYFFNCGWSRANGRAPLDHCALGARIELVQSFYNRAHLRSAQSRLRFNINAGGNSNEDNESLCGDDR